MWDQSYKDTIWMVLFTELCFKTAVFSFNLLFLKIFCHKKFVIFPLFYLQCILMKCEINIKIMTFIDLQVTWLPNWIHSAWINKLDIPCKNTTICEFLWRPIKGPNLSLKVSAHKVDGLWHFISAQTIIMFDLVLILLSLSPKSCMFLLICSISPSKLYS